MEQKLEKPWKCDCCRGIFITKEPIRFNKMVFCSERCLIECKNYRAKRKMLATS